MKKKITIIIIFIIIVSILIIGTISTEIDKNVENISEIQPEEEISDEEMRQTNLDLYFEDSTSRILVKEERKIDSKNLIDNPYKEVLNMLIQGPKSEKMTNPIPEGTKINNTKYEKGILYIDLSSEFLNSNGTNSIYSIVNTMTEFNEINGVKFTIDGEVKDGLKETFVKINT